MKLPCLHLLVILLVFTIKGYTQEQRVFKQGIYTSWEELLNNTPKYTDLPSVKYKKIRTYNILDEIHRIAILDISKEKANSIGEAFAFSNGQELFINEKKTDLSKAPYFTLVEMHNKSFGISNDLFAINFNKNVGVGNFPMYCKISGTNILDFQKKIITKIKGKNSLKKFIASDPELLNQFESEDDKNEVIKLYIIQFFLRKL